MNRNTLLSTVAVSALVAFAAPAFADSLTPATFSATIGLGGSTSINNKVGTISAGTPTSAQADVMFVVDTTGSMSAGIADVTSAFSTTVSNLSALGSIATGAAQYKDKTNAGDPFDYQLNQDITTTAAATQTAIGGYTASGGGDTPEQGLYALDQAATTTTWRPGSKRIVVITGDAPSHSSPTYPTAAGGVSVSSVASTLTSNGVTMIALDASPVTMGGPGLDAYGQFSGLITDGVSGSTGNFTNATTLTNTLTSLISSAFQTYSTVSLGLVGPAPSCVSVSLPSSFTGSFDRSVDRTFNFGPVGITGTAAGSCSFQIGLFADGALLATENDSITVGTVATPEPGTLALFATAVMGIGLVDRRRRKRRKRA